jgi:hypothetical protein
VDDTSDDLFNTYAMGYMLATHKLETSQGWYKSTSLMARNCLGQMIEAP